MKIIRFTPLFFCLTLFSCATQSVDRVDFENSLSYDFQLDIDKIKKSGDFLVILGKNKEKIVISENHLDEILNQIKPSITSLEFFDQVYDESINKPKVSSQVIDFKNGFLDQEVKNKRKRNKKNSVIYLWEFPDNKFKIIELANGKNYFLSIYVENYGKNNFLAE